MKFLPGETDNCNAGFPFRIPFSRVLRNIIETWNIIANTLSIVIQVIFIQKYNLQPNITFSVLVFNYEIRKTKPYLIRFKKSILPSQNIK